MIDPQGFPLNILATSLVAGALISGMIIRDKWRLTREIARRESNLDTLRARVRELELRSDLLLDQREQARNRVRELEAIFDRQPEEAARLSKCLIRVYDMVYGGQGAGAKTLLRAAQVCGARVAKGLEKEDAQEEGRAIVDLCDRAHQLLDEALPAAARPRG